MCKLTFPWQAFYSQWFKECPFFLDRARFLRLELKGGRPRTCIPFTTFFRGIRVRVVALRLVYGYIALARSQLY